MSVRAALFVMILLQAGASYVRAEAAQAEPHALAAQAARRFPQPVRAGNLVGRAVIRPVESQDLLGHVSGVVRGPDGALLVVMRTGGVLGVGARRIAVPLDAMVLVGDVMEVLGLSPAELDGLPPYDGGGAAPVGPDEGVRVRLAKPPH